MTLSKQLADLELNPCKCTPKQAPNMDPSFGPLATTIYTALTNSLKPVHLEIKNDSWKHSHHAPMEGNTNPETHFKVTVVSDSFDGLNPVKRHRLVYGLLKDNGVIGDGSKNDGKVHALQIVAKTPTQWEE